MLAVVAPGQGAQRAGGLGPWLNLPGFAETIARLGDYAQMDLVAIGTKADAEAITHTELAQPLIVATGIGVGRMLDLDPERTVWAGHSVGELTVAALSGCLSERDAMHLAAERGRAVADASTAIPTGMSAVVGGDPDEVLARLAELDLTAANFNGASQIVAAGRLDRLTALRDDPPSSAKIVPLRVSGAFHTAFMRPARERFATAVAAVTAGRISGTLLSNADGAPVRSSDQALRQLVAQICSPVRWDATAAQIAGLGIRRVIELAPAGTLAGLLRRSHPELELVALRSPADLEAVSADTV